MEVLFNSEVIKLKEGYEDLGIDYAAWHIADDIYDVDEYKLNEFPCFKAG